MNVWSQTIKCVVGVLFSVQSGLNGWFLIVFWTASQHFCNQGCRYDDRRSSTETPRALWMIPPHVLCCYVTFFGPWLYLQQQLLLVKPVMWPVVRWWELDHTYSESESTAGQRGRFPHWEHPTLCLLHPKPPTVTVITYSWCSGITTSCSYGLLSSVNNPSVSDQYDLLLQRILGNNSHRNMLLCIMRNASGCRRTSWYFSAADWISSWRSKEYAMEHGSSFVPGKLVSSLWIVSELLVSLTRLESTKCVLFSNPLN